MPLHGNVWVPMNSGGVRPLEAKFREAMLHARPGRTWCCDIRSKQNENICQKQTQHPCGTHYTRLHFETGGEAYWLTGLFTSTHPPLAPTHFPIWSWTTCCHVRAVTVCSREVSDATLFQHMLIRVWVAQVQVQGQAVHGHTQFDRDHSDSCPPTYSQA